MKTGKEYIYAEPEPVQAYMDQNGELWTTRETAIRENIKHDMTRVLRGLRVDPPQRAAFFAVLDALAKDHPQLLADYMESIS